MDPYEMPRRVPEPVKHLVYACLHKDPGQRPTTEELSELIRPIMEALPRRG
jgi:hypothetical protein